MEEKDSGTDYANLALGALIFGIGLLLFGVVAIAKSVIANSWHTTQDRVVESKMVDGFEMSTPHILYRYEVEGKSYAFLFFTGDSVLN